MAECDMEKFFDTVNHKIAKVLYDELVNQCKELYSNLDLSQPSYLFRQFLDCYAFNINVPLPEDAQYWDSYDIPNGNFKWVLKEIEDLGYYENVANERIGIPQGGALSGLIANIMLNVADKVMLQTGVSYLRFCDDMIILHPDKVTCSIAKELYVNTLKGLKLVPHNFKSEAELTAKRMTTSKERKKLGSISFESFWKVKSKGPYKWGAIEEGCFPWIGFVGYEIHHQGHVRVRKNLFLKN
ncbi:MAG: RNA-directed DNA polymerase [Bacteroidetes bacterium]|nr:RNA-directed DNA polymerase [Bacteroidota bacterium]